MNRYECIKAYMYILPEIAAHHLQLKCMGGHFFPFFRTIPTQRVLPYSLITNNSSYDKKLSFNFSQMSYIHKLKYLLFPPKNENW